MPSAAISHDLNHIVYGGTDKKNYKYGVMKKKIIQLDNWVCYVKFTEDTKYLYVAKMQYYLL